MLRSSFRRLVSNNLQAAFSTSHEPPALFEYHNKVCKVILNRPKALNAQNVEMIRLLQQELNKWNATDNTKVALFTGAGGKAFSVGGDIKFLYETREDPRADEMHDHIFREEYMLDHALSVMKPIQVAFWDGIVMGGGVGISVNAPVRIATEKSVFAMPEANIGLFTDCGAGYFFSRLRNNLGYFLGITAYRLKGDELFQTGLADYYIKSEKLKSLEKEIIDKTNASTKVEDIKAIVQKYHEPVKNEKFVHEDFVKDIFGYETVDEIYKALKNTKQNREFADKLIATMDTHNPFSMKVIHEHIKRGAGLDLKENLRNDFRLSQRFMRGTDFFEGTRCVLVDRHDKPRWVYPTLEQVPREEVEKYFEKLPPNLELKFTS